MDEHTPPHASSDSLLRYSEKEWVRYVNELKKTASALPQVALETCTHIETQVRTLGDRVDALYATMQQSVSMCGKNVNVSKKPSRCVRLFEQICKI